MSDDLELTTNEPAAVPRDKAKTLASDSTPLTLTVTEVDGNASSSRDTSFRSPGP